MEKYELSSKNHESLMAFLGGRGCRGFFVCRDDMVMAGGFEGVVKSLDWDHFSSIQG